MLYRLRNSVNYTRFRLGTRRIHTSPPIACQEDAPCEVHTMLSERDVPLYLVAIKSLLRFCQGVAVVLHSDGTLSQKSIATVRRHVPGCRVIMPAEADDRARQHLGADSLLYRWRSLDASYRRIIDTELWCSSGRRIIMDSDIIILNRPHEVIDWAEHGKRPFLMGQPPILEHPAPGSFASRYVGTIFREKIGPLSEALGYPSSYLDGTTSGFYGCLDELQLDRIEKVLVTSTSLGIPMTEWGGEQSTVIYLLSIAGAVRLNPDRYFNFFRDQTHKVDGAMLIHFIGTDRFYKGIYVHCARRVIADLCKVREPLTV